MYTRTIRGKTTVKVHKSDTDALTNARGVCEAMARQDWPAARAAAGVRDAIDSLEKLLTPIDKPKE
jgi:hypothetical protein